MPRNTSKPTILLAVTIADACRALSLPGASGGAALKEAILMGELDCKSFGSKKLIPVCGPKGLAAWFEKLPRAQ